MKFVTKIILFVLFSIAILSPFSIKKNQVNKTRLPSVTLNISFAQSEEVDIDDAGFLDCSTFDFACKGINFLQIIFVTGGNILVGLSAFVMDTFLFHSLQSGSYSGSGFITQGWEILRDLTNIIFIFALLVTAFKMVLGQDDAGNKRTLFRTIIVALVINFSLFLSFAIIDASNLLAYTFYNKIEQQEVTFDASSSGGQNGSIQSEEQFKGSSTSLAIAKKINPQRLLNADAVSDGTVTKGQRVVMVLMAGVINGTLIYVFLSVSFLFLGRTIGLWLSVVLSPLAFASVTVPTLEKMKYIGFSNWLSSILQMSFMAPVFIFFLYLAVQFMEINIGFAGSGSGDFINNILNIVIPMAAIIVLITTAKKVAASMSGDFAGTISGVIGKAVGGTVALGSVAATGGFAALGGIARGASRVAGGQNSRTGRFLQGAGQRLQATNFNFAQSRIGQEISKRTGVNMGANLGNLSYARADTAVRRGANNLRAGIHDLQTGRTPESIQGWQENIEESRQTLQRRRNENVEQQAEQNARTNANATERTYDYITQTETTIPVDNLPGRIEELQAERNRRSAADIQTEEDNIRNNVNNFNANIQTERDDIRRMEQERQRLMNAGNTGAANAITVGIANRRQRIRDIEQNIRQVERSSLDRRIEHLEGQLQNRRHDARAQLLQEDQNSRFTTQDSSLTINEDRRQERVQRRAARSGRSQPGNES